VHKEAGSVVGSANAVVFVPAFSAIFLIFTFYLCWHAPNIIEAPGVFEQELFSLPVPVHAECTTAIEHSQPRRAAARNMT